MMGTPPVFEPGLEDLTLRGIASGRLRFTRDATAVSAADVVWMTADTPVDENDKADVASIVTGISGLFPHIQDGALVIMSSQVPVGTTALLEKSFETHSQGRRVRFAYAPENLRLGKAIEVFTRPDRVVVGLRHAQDRETIAELFRPFTDRIVWMSVESAEMTKHALNAFLATSVTFINEVAALCEQVGADASEVERGLKSDARIGPGAYLSPGGAFAGGTLARDVTFLSDLGKARGVATHLLEAVHTSNHVHGHWPRRRLTQILGALDGKTIAVWGLTYKPGTDTLRRSSAVELCRWLIAQGATVRTHDPVVRRLPTDLDETVRLIDDPLAAADDAAALVVATNWPAYRDIDASQVADRMSGNLILDASGFLAASLGRASSLRYLRVGTPIA